MISKHSHEQSSNGEGVEVVKNEPYTDEQHGTGQYTEKRIYLNGKLPDWIKWFIPRIFYLTERAWNSYPFTLTEYTCSFLPKFHIRIETKFENNNGNNQHVFGKKTTPKDDVCNVDIVTDLIPEKCYKESEDLTKFKSLKTGRGPFSAGWQKISDPIMCSYKLVSVKFEMYGFQTKVEGFVQKSIKDILLVGHRQAVAWIDEWIDMSMEDVRNFEKELQEETNKKVISSTETDSGSLIKEDDSNRVGITRSASMINKTMTQVDTVDGQRPLMTRMTSSPH
ncbi:cytoplasmic phosphatidylinositol transfer protein 1-like isoform X2 [Protopterus annectens]|nr:cytoplasmic phosphatidylinositol transfer protein 1-like isoform X2 [Protopterus annectens]